jgi:uncharacterized membrane protein
MDHQAIRNMLAEKNFRWRGHEISRIEGFSDAVFGFAVTLLVVSLEVPKTFTELKEVMQGFPAFGICFSLLLLVWRTHVHFFRRYGLQTAWASALNAILLFLVLFYVYPLKFLFTLVVGHRSQAERMIEPGQIASLMIIYGLGYAAIFLVFALLYVHAYRLRDAMHLNELEIFLTRRSIFQNLAMVGFGLASALLASLLGQHAGLAGFIYTFIGVYFTIEGMTMGKRENELAAKYPVTHS